MDHTKISAEEKAYQKIPVINDFKDRNGNDIMMQQIQRNYDQIKADAQVIINEEMRRIKNDPELRKRLGLEDEKWKGPRQIMTSGGVIEEFIPRLIGLLKKDAVYLKLEIEK